MPLGRTRSVLPGTMRWNRFCSRCHFILAPYWSNSLRTVPGRSSVPRSHSSCRADSNSKRPRTKLVAEPPGRLWRSSTSVFLPPRALCGRAALAVEGKTEESFAEALYYYHRTLMKLSGNTITPLILNALITAVLPFWSEYEQTNGVEAALQGLAHFTDLIEQGEGEQAAQLLRDGIRRHKEEHGYL